MISYSTPYTLASGNISTENVYSVESEQMIAYTYNVGYYDDTKIKQRLSLLEGEVSDLQRDDEGFNRRLSLIEGNYVTKPEFNQLEGRVTTLETVPVGLDSETMDEILND